MDVGEHRSEARIIARGGEPAAEPRRLLFVTGTPLSVLDGSGTYVGITVLRRALEEAGHRVDLVAPSHRSPATLLRLLFNVGAWKAARGRRLDAIVGFDLDGLFVSAHGARRVASIKGVIADELQFERGSTRRSLRVASWLEKLHIRRSDVVLTTSAYSASRIADEYGADRSRIRIVPEPIELPRWKAALAAVPSRARGAETVVLTVAHLYPRKGIAKLLRAILLVRSPVKLRIVGIGPERENLEGLAREIGLADRVTFLGHLSFDRLVEEYRGADVFCLPSLQEGFGIVFLEAMAASLPIVACQAAAVPEVVPDLECGLLVPPDDVPALAFALDRLAGSAADRRKMGEAGARRVAQYDAPVVAEMFLDAIGLGRRGPSRGEVGP
jgi:glycosyltransferase involved in cell wall biosynthesis